MFFLLASNFQRDLIQEGGGETALGAAWWDVAGHPAEGGRTTWRQLLEPSPTLAWPRPGVRRDRVLVREKQASINSRALGSASPAVTY